MSAHAVPSELNMIDGFAVSLHLEPVFHDGSHLARAVQTFIGAAQDEIRRAASLANEAAADIRPIRWAVEQVAMARGVASINDLSKRLKKRWATVRDHWYGYPRRVDFSTLTDLCRGLSCMPDHLLVRDGDTAPVLPESIPNLARLAVQFNLWPMLAEKKQIHQAAETKKTVKEIADELQLNWVTAERLLRGELTRVDLAVLEHLCHVLTCAPGDLLRFVELPETMP